MLLFVLSLALTVQSHSYHKSKFVHSANFITGGIYTLKSDVTGYFGLRTENRLLLEENSQLKNQLQLYEAKQLQIKDSTMPGFEFVYRPAEVINNSFSKANNYLTLKGGSNQGFKPLMGVITANGIVGITDQVSPNYTTVLSLLNSKSSISVALKESGHFGSLIWDGSNPSTMHLIDISRQAPVKLGDTIITDGRSTIFPKDLLVGTISDFKFDNSGNFYILDVNLFNDMTRTRQVYVIENTEAQKIQELESKSHDE